MKKAKHSKLLYAAAILLLAGFAICLGADYYRYSTTLNSAPFSVWVLVRAIEFGVPAMAAFVAGRILRKRAERTKEE